MITGFIIYCVIAIIIALLLYCHALFDDIMDKISLGRSSQKLGYNFKQPLTYGICFLIACPIINVLVILSLICVPNITITILARLCVSCIDSFEQLQKYFKPN